MNAIAIPPHRRPTCHPRTINIQKKYRSSYLLFENVPLSAPKQPPWRRYLDVMWIQTNRLHPGTCLWSSLLAAPEGCLWKVLWKNIRLLPQGMGREIYSYFILFSKSALLTYFGIRHSGQQWRSAHMPHPNRIAKKEGRERGEMKEKEKERI